jgi:hypothetical protein
MDLPLWAIALVLAAVAPWCVRAIAGVLENRSRDRTREVLRAAGIQTADPAAMHDAA